MDLFWTKHSREKMQFYGLSEQRIKRVLRNPDRIEEGIAPKTIALMQIAGSKKNPYEIWVMYQKKEKSFYHKLTTKDIKSKQNNFIKKPVLKIISCWKYPGRSPIGVKLPVPDELKQEIENVLNKIKKNEKNY
ncbi:MAG: DUF4258 domain-containing protein [Candidatus Pacebacteria bacterium]|nr:DUF4258 domain-containing protein [Candidatus Paceibacterota bacterium]